MSVICQCPSCKSKYQVGDQYAGRTVKCPKCSAAVAVPAVAQPASPTGGAVVAPAVAQPASQSATASKTSSAGGTAKAASPPISAKAELPQAQAVSRAEVPPAAAAPAASSPAKIPRPVTVSPADSATDDQDADGEPPADDVFGFLSAEPAEPKRPAGSKQRPAATVAKQASDEAEPADDGLGFLAEGPAGAQRPAATVAKQSSDEAEPADGLASISALAARSSKGVPAYYPKKKKKGFPGWVIPTIAGVGVGAIVLIAAIFYLNSNSPTKGGSNATASTPPGGKGSGKAASGPKVPVLHIDWPESSRAGGSLLVNGSKTDLPMKGPIEIPLPPSKDQYRFHLERPGFKPKEFARVIQEDDNQAISDWEPLEAKGIDWEQDFDVAKKTAASEHKNVLIFFDASDSKESSYASSRFKEAVVKRKEFQERTDKGYVCVYIDNPKNAEAQNEVKDADRNRKLTEKFHISVFPTVVVLDPRGKPQPFGIMDGYSINGVSAFLEILDKWDADGKTLHELLAKTGNGAGNSDLVGETLDFLQMNHLERFYHGTINELTARLPAGEGRKVTKEMAQTWMRRFKLAANNSDQAKKVVDEFDQFIKNRTFQDHEMGAALHLAAAGLLTQLNLRKEAAEHCKDGLALQPHDSRTRTILKQLSQYLNHEPGKPFLMPVGSGSGFCVVQGNYVLTCHHVIHKAKQIQIHLNDDEERYPATLVGDDEAGDMALLKIDLPAAKSLAPIPLAATVPKLGEEVCVMGWPGDLSQNVSLTLTRGIVSTLVGPNDDERMIATDCKATHGDSGGPLCSANGVVGMISRGSSGEATAYGLSIPVDRLRRFVLAKLPADAKKPPTPAVEAGLRLSDRADVFQHSVVYFENLQEINHRASRGEQQGSEPEK